MREPLPTKTCSRDIGGKRVGPLPFHRVRLWASCYPMSSHRARARIIGVRILRALPRLSALVSAETYCASACGTSGCRNDGRGCATWCDAYRCRESAWALLAQTVANYSQRGSTLYKDGSQTRSKGPSVSYISLWTWFRDQTSSTDLTLRSVSNSFHTISSISSSSPRRRTIFDDYLTVDGRQAQAHDLFTKTPGRRVRRTVIGGLTGICEFGLWRMWRFNDNTTCFFFT